MSRSIPHCHASLPQATLSDNITAAMQQCQLARNTECMFAGLPSELLCTHILGRLDARSLAMLEATCSFFSAGQLPLGEQAASQKLVTSVGPAEAARFT